MIAHALAWGVALSLYLGSSFCLLARINPEMWLGDYPPDIRERWGPMSTAARRQRLVFGVPVLLLGLAIVTASDVHFARTDPASAGFMALFAHTWIVLMVFNVIDLLIIDWILFVRIRPSFVVLPGTEDLAGYDDDAFHAVAFLKGTVGITVVSALLGVAVPLLA